MPLLAGLDQLDWPALPASLAGIFPIISGNTLQSPWLQPAKAGWRKGCKPWRLQRDFRAWVRNGAKGAVSVILARNAPKTRLHSAEILDRCLGAKTAKRPW